MCCLSLKVSDMSDKAAQKFEIDGKEYTLPEVARMYGLSPQLLRSRLNGGKSLEEALKQPVAKYVKRDERKDF